jgi:SM-20-related protein
VLPSSGTVEQPVQYFSYDAIARTRLEKEPFDYVIVPNCMSADALNKVGVDFPAVPGPGSHPPDALQIKGHFAALLQELESAQFREAVEQKFAIDLAQRPTMCTVRGFVQKKDGSIHTDSKTKIITVLLYLNEAWDAAGGCLRLLRSGTDLEDYVAELPPSNGTLLIFRRSDNSWHGHKPYEGPRRAIQFNWVTDEAVVKKEQARHRLSTRLKRLKGLFLGSRGVTPSEAHSRAARGPDERRA